MKILSLAVASLLLISISPAQSEDREVIELRDQVKALQDRLDKLGTGLAKPDVAQSQQTEASGGLGNPYQKQVCPAGYYASGVQAFGAPGNVKYCVGCLTGVVLICSPFPK